MLQTAEACLTKSPRTNPTLLSPPRQKETMNMYYLCSGTYSNGRTYVDFAKDSLTRLRQSGEPETRIIEWSFDNKDVCIKSVSQTCDRFADWEVKEKRNEFWSRFQKTWRQSNKKLEGVWTFHSVINNSRRACAQGTRSTWTAEICHSL